MKQSFLAAAAMTLAVCGGNAPRAEVAPGARGATVDDLMKLRSIVDVQIAPDGQHVAYVVSTPNLANNQHDGALFVVSASGGAPRAIGGDVKIFNVPTPPPQLRWRPDGAAIARLA